MARTGGPVEVEGVAELRRALGRFEDRVADLDDTADEGADLLQNEARSRAPVVSATLRDSIRVERREGGASVLAGGAGVPYAEVIHFGWRARNIEPQPFLWDVLDERRDEVVRRYEGKVDKEVKRLDREAPK